MPDLPRDSILPTPATLDSDETLLARFPPDPATYWRSHAVMAALGALGAGLVLLALGNPHPWTGPLAAVLAIGARAAYLRSEALGEDWRLTARRLLGPGGRSVPLSQVRTAAKFLDAVQVVTKSGDKHLIRFQSDPGAVAAAILRQAGQRGG